MHFPALSQEEELHWLALKLIPGLGTRTAGKLIEKFRTPQAIFRASRTELEKAGVSGAVAQSIERSAFGHDLRGEPAPRRLVHGDGHPFLFELRFRLDQ